MKTIEQKESEAANMLRKFANVHAISYSLECDTRAATLALLWCAFVDEAKEMGLTQWRGIKLEDV